MKKNISKIFLSAIFVLFASNSAWAVIDSIVVPYRGGLASTFRPDTAVPVPQRTQMVLQVFGFGTDLAVDVEVSGSGVASRISDRKPGNGSYVGISLDISDNAAATVRTVTIKYPLGQDTFKIKVTRVGTISNIEYEQPSFPVAATSAVITGGIGGGGISGGGLRTATRLVPAENVPQDEKIILALTGTKLDGVRVIPNSTDYYTARVLPGATETRCRIEIEFRRGGRHQLRVYSTEKERIGPYSFAYEGVPRDSLEVTVKRDGGGGGNTGGNIGGGGGNTGGGVIGGGSQQPAAFVDVALRANMLNVFRRLSNFAPFELNGRTFVRVEDRWCAGMSGNSAKIITAPDLVWGVSNFGTQNVTQQFSAVLKSNGAALDTKNIFTLGQGITVDFTFRRRQSTVQVQTRSDRQGCFISPDADTQNYFEDPAFTVEVDAAGALNENQNNRANNSRNY